MYVPKITAILDHHVIAADVSLESAGNLCIDLSTSDGIPMFIDKLGHHGIEEEDV